MAYVVIERVILNDSYHVSVVSGPQQLQRSTACLMTWLVSVSIRIPLSNHPHRPCVACLQYETVHVFVCFFKSLVKEVNKLTKYSVILAARSKLHMVSYVFHSKSVSHYIVLVALFG